MSIAVAPSNPSVAKGLTEQFTATGTYTDSSTANLTTQVTWASANPAVATINTAGLASALATGTTAITAALGGITSPCDTLTVTAAALPTSVYVSPSYASDTPGTPVTWTDGSTHTVGIDAFGTIQSGINAVAAGGTVNVASGTYTEQLTIGKSLSVVGAGPSSTTIQAPASLIGNEIEISSGLTVTMSGLNLDGASTSTAIDVNGGDLSASNLAITGYNVGVSVENAGSVTVTDSTITSSTTGILVGSGSSDTSTLTATNDSFAGDTVGVQNNQSSGQLTTAMDWWGSSTGPNNTGNPGGTGAKAIGSVNFSPWLGDTNIVAPDYLVFLSTTGEAFVVTPNSGNTSLGVSLSGNPTGSISGRRHALVRWHRRDRHHQRRVRAGQHRRLHHQGYVGPVQRRRCPGRHDDQFPRHRHDPIRGCPGNDQHVQYPGRRRQRTVRKPGGRLGHECVRLQRTAKLIGSIQGGGTSTLNYSAYSSGVNVNLGNGTNGTATGVSGTVTGITALIGGNSNDTLNAGTVPNVALTGGLGTNSLSGTGAGDSVVESIASSYTLTNTKLTGTGASFTDNLSGITVASLTGVSADEQCLHSQRLDRDRVAVRPGGHWHRDG